MISRVAEACFWHVRYLERVESLARLLHVNLAFQLDVRLPDAERWRPLVVVVGEEERFLTATPARQLDNADTVQQFLSWDADNPASLYSGVREARENARTVRETISLEMWETVNELWLWLNRRVARNLYARDRHEFYVRIRDACLLFQGFAQNTMLHEEPYDFMQLGRALERAAQTTRTLDVKYESFGPTRSDVEMPDEAAQWLAVLRSCSAIEPFFKASGRTLSGAAAAEFLLLEPNFPRSVRYNLEWAARVLAEIRPSEAIGGRSMGQLTDLVRWIRSLSLGEVLKTGIHGTLTRVVEETAAVCESVGADYFHPRLPDAGAEARPSERTL